MKIISGIYKITNTITNDFYIGSSKNVKKRWTAHKCQSTWNEHPNNPLYQDMQKYGVDKFSFELLAEVEEDSLKETEQEFIEALKPTYNDRNAKGWNIERQKESNKKASRKYNKSDKRKKYLKEYNKSDRQKEYNKQYQNQLCSFNGETLTLNALSKCFWRQGLSNPTQEAKKYLL